MAVKETPTPLARFEVIKDFVVRNGRQEPGGVSVFTPQGIPASKPQIDLALTPAGNGELYLRYRSPRDVEGVPLVRTRVKVLSIDGDSLDPSSATGLALPQEVSPHFDFSGLEKAHTIPPLNSAPLVDIFLNQMESVCAS